MSCGGEVYVTAQWQEFAILDSLLHIPIILFGHIKEI